MNDSDTTIAQLRENIRRFVVERDWEQFHSPKNLAMALAVEAAELMEHFQWIDIAESRQLAKNPDKLAAICEELADVLSYTLALANSLNIDVASTHHAKMEKNVAKYPADAFRGRFGTKGA
jgi:NTP pyrophosphatase (non-canonical NTP hydrolase)